MCWTHDFYSTFHTIQQAFTVYILSIMLWAICCCSVTQSCLTFCDPHGLQHTRLPCHSPSPSICSNSCPLSWWCHQTIPSSVVPFSCLQSFPVAEPFPISRHIRQPKDWSFSFSLSSSNVYSGLISFSLWLVWPPCCPRDSQECSPAHSSNESILQHSAFFTVQLSHPSIHD